MTRTRTSIAAALATALLASAVPTVAGAQTQTTPDPGANGGGVEQPRVSIDNCTVRKSRNAGGFTYFYCSVVTDPTIQGSGTVQYSVNLPVFTPKSGGTWSKQRGTLRLSGNELLSLKFATHRSVAQVKSNLKVTLGNAQGMVVVDGTATAGSAPAAT
jgi:hypothetical protein